MVARSKGMGNELIRPIDPDSAHAIEETAKAAAKAIDAAVQAGRYVGEVMGDLPHDSGWDHWRLGQT